MGSMSARSPLSGLSYDASTPAIGDSDKTYTITLPNPKSLGSAAVGFARCLLLLPIFYRNVNCRIDDEFINSLIPSEQDCHACCKSQYWTSDHAFAINDNSFLCLNTDHPSYGAEKWLPLYQRYVKGIFILQYRDSTRHLFSNAQIPIEPLPCKLDHRADEILFELGHSQSMTCEKDISIFFHGRKTIRPARKPPAIEIKKKFPDSFINFIDRGESCLTQEEYFNAMCRSKIVWCPRSAWEDPDRECNGLTGREIEAMCLEIMIIRNPLGVKEAETRIPGVHFVEFQNNDSKDLIEKLSYYLEHDEERRQIARNGRLYWERNLSNIARANNLFLSCLKMTAGNV